MSLLMELLAELRDAARSEREKGTYFERLCVEFLKHDPEMAQQYEDAWTFREWAEVNGWKQTDTGIDLVAKLRNGAGAGPEAGRVSRIPSGHPEGYLEGFANIYQEAARAIRAARKKGGKPAKDVIYPTVEDGVEGVAFVEACVKSSKKNGAWTKL